MSKKNMLFNNITTYHELTNLMKENINYLTTSYFNQDTLETSLNSFFHMKENQKTRLMDFAKYLDQYMNEPQPTGKNRLHKIPTLFAAAIYLNNYQEQIADYTDKELAILAKYSIIEFLDFYEMAPINYPRELLNAIFEKGLDYREHEDYMFLVTDCFKDTNTPNEIINIINSTPRRELLQKSFAYQKNMMEGEIYESRRI